MGIIGEIMGSYSFICAPCAEEEGLPFIGILYHGMCDYCDRRWVDIVEIERKRPKEKKERGGGNVEARLKAKTNTPPVDPSRHSETDGTLAENHSGLQGGS